MLHLFAKQIKCDKYSLKTFIYGFIFDYKDYKKILEFISR